MRETNHPEGASGRRRMFALFAATAVALLGLVLAIQRPADAHDHGIPKTVLMKGKKELQTGLKVGWSDWFSRTGAGECVHAHADYALRFPRVDTVAAGSKLKVRVHKRQKPRSFALGKVDAEGNPRGEVGVRLKPVVRNERTVAWDAVFRVQRPDTRYRLIGEGYWKDREGCGGDQHAFWSYQVKTGSATSP